MSGFDIGLQLFTDAFNSKIFGYSYLMPIGLIILSLAVITRRYNKWKELAFPVTIGWYTIGLKMSFVFLLVTGALFILETSSVQIIGNAMRGVYESAQETVGKKARTQRKHDRVKEIKDARQYAKLVKIEEGFKKAERRKKFGEELTEKLKLKPEKKKESYDYSWEERELEKIRKKKKRFGGFND